MPFGGELGGRAREVMVVAPRRPVQPVLVQVQVPQQAAVRGAAAGVEAGAARMAGSTAAAALAAEVAGAAASEAEVVAVAAVPPPPHLLAAVARVARATRHQAQAHATGLMVVVREAHGVVGEAEVEAVEVVVAAVVVVVQVVVGEVVVAAVATVATRVRTRHALATMHAREAQPRRWPEPLGSRSSS